MSHSGQGLLKWQIALGLGAVGAIGLTYWFYKTNKQLKIDRITKSIQINKNKNNTEINQDKKETPFELAQRYKVEGNSCFKNGRYDEAIEFYTKAIDTIPKEYKTELATYFQNRAAAYEQLNKWSAVIKDCTNALDLNTKYEKAFYRRAKAYETVEDLENSLDDITTVCILQKFQNQNALLMADRILKQLGKKHAKEEMKTRRPVLPSKNYVQTYFASFIDHPIYEELFQVTEPLGLGELKGFLKAKLAFATEKYEEIIPACTEELNLSESESIYKMEALCLRSTFYSMSGQFNEAIDDLTTIINAEEADNKFTVNALIRRATIYMQMERLTECLQDFDIAAKLGESIADVFLHRGQIKLLMEKSDEALADFKRAVELNPNFPIALVQKCYADYQYAAQIGNVDLVMKSIENFRSAIDKFPNCPEAYVLFAQVETERGLYTEAELLYNKVLRLDPTYSSGYVHKGLLYLQWKGDTEQAADLMRQAIKIDDKSGFAYETLGTIEVQKGNLDNAIDLFDKAIQLAKAEIEIMHLYSLKDAAVSQKKISSRFE